MTRKAAGPVSRTPLEGKLCGTETVADLHREAANMLELQSRQSNSGTALSLPSKAAQTVLRQF